nr:hypothetical protein [uncultured Nocardioides sp.]
MPHDGQDTAMTPALLMPDLLDVTGAALAPVAANLGSGQTQVVAQNLGQCPAVLDLEIVCLAVDTQRNTRAWSGVSRAVVDLLHEERATSLAESMAAADSVAGVLAAFERWAEQHIGDVGWTAMEVELATSTRMIPGVGQELAARRRELTSMLGAMLEHQAGLLGLRLPVPPEDAAVQLLAMGIGLGVQRAFDPELPITALVDLLRSLLERATPV